MYIASECDAVCKEYNKMTKERSKKLSKIWSYIFLAFLIVMIILPLIPNFLDKGPGWTLYIIYGGMAFIGLSIALLVSTFTISDIPAFEYLYKEIYHKINQEKGTFYEYFSYEKEKWEFNKNGGLFSRHCRIEVKRHISGITLNDNKFDIFDANFITGSGKNQRTHFTGIYFLIKQSSSKYFQIRSHSKPHLKGVDFIKNKDIKDINVYLEEESSMSNLEYKYIETLNRLKRNLNAKKIYLSVTKDEIHFAYVPTVQIRKQYNLNIQKMNELYTLFLDEIRYIDELVDTSNF